MILSIFAENLTYQRLQTSLAILIRYLKLKLAGVTPAFKKSKFNWLIKQNPRRYPGHACISVNEEVVHGIGSLKRILQDGDIVALDVVVSYNGYIGDNATTVPVGAISPRVQELLTVSRQALDLGVAQARVGNRIGDISYAIQHHCEKHGFGIVREMVGHGVGVAMHEEPQIPNYGRKGSGAKIYPGMTLAIEPMVNLGTHKTKTLSDGWTIVTADSAPSAHFEFTVLTREEGPEILTVPPSGAL